MLWMLGVVAILVDVISRFSGGGGGGGGNTSPIISTTITAPGEDSEIAYIIVNEKQPLSSLKGLDIEDLSKGSDTNNISIPADPAKISFPADTSGQPFPAVAFQRSFPADTKQSSFPAEQSKSFPAVPVKPQPTTSNTVPVPAPKKIEPSDTRIETKVKN